MNNYLISEAIGEMVGTAYMEGNHIKDYKKVKIGWSMSVRDLMRL